MRLYMTPYVRLALSLAVLILVGWVVLMLPGMSAGRPATWLEGLFTSASAVCVTGLTVRSTGHDWSLAGQVVILLLIQIGGLGLMTLSSSVLMHLRRKATLDEAAMIRESLGSASPDALPILLRRCLRIVLWIEAVGASLLFVRFLLEKGEGSPWYIRVANSAWTAVFHSVSAFCNAGFSLWDDSLMRYATDPWVNLVIGGLVVLGGLGFFVLADLEAWLRGLRKKQIRALGFQTRLVLVTTLALLVGGAILIWLGEHRNEATLRGHGLFEQYMMAQFQSLTARTAGFNTVDIGQLTIPSVGVLIILMFIGASPGSCGGGIKTTTFAVLVVLATSAWRRDREPTFQGRAFGRVTISSAVALFFAAFLLVLFGSIFLLMIESGGAPLSREHGRFASLVFEATSAFGTVGLSTGITEHLRVPSKLCLIGLMFLGRVGPLGLVSASLRGAARPVIRYPHEDVQIG